MSRICDRCEGQNVKIMLVNSQTKEEIDLCEACSFEFEEWRSNKEIELKRKVGRPRKDGSD